MDIATEAAKIAEEQGMDAAEQFILNQDNKPEELVEDDTPEEPTEDNVEEVNEESGEEVELEQQVDSLSDEQIEALADRLVENGGEVPAWVVKKLRKQKADAKKELEQTSSKVDETVSNLSSIMNTLQQPKPESKAFDKDEFSEMLSYEPDKAADAIAEQIKALQEQVNQSNQSVQTMQLVGAIDSLERNASLRNSNFEKIRNKYIDMQASTLKSLYPGETEASLKAYAAQKYLSEAASYVQAGQDPTLVLESYMQNFPIEEPKQTKDIDIDALSQAINKHKTLGGKAPKVKDSGVEPTLNQLKDMSQEQLFKFGNELAKKHNKANDVKITPQQALTNYMSEAAKKESGLG